MIGTLKEVVKKASEGEMKRLVVPLPDIPTLKVLSQASEANLITPILVGDGADIERMVKSTHLADHPYEIIDEKEGTSSLTTAIKMVRNHGDILMQGTTDHQTFMDAVLNEKDGLLNGTLASFASVFQLLRRDKLIIITDTYINNFPTLPEKIAILENAITLAEILDIPSPKVAVLAAIEQINLNIPSTIEGAVLSKMAERKQFGNVIVEGPLDIDCALHHEKAERKGVQSVVTGDVDIYLVPEVETGYLVSELLVYFGKMAAAGLVMGTLCPVILDLPFVTQENRSAEVALAVLLSGKG